MVSVRVEHGDCLSVLRTMPDASVDAIVTDPPAGIAFMGKAWDHHKGGRKEWVAWMAEIAAECLRVIKPGGHALVWALPRTSHWTGGAWEDAEWQPRDKIYHVFGSGFPKSMDVSKSIDKMAGAERQVVGDTGNGRKSQTGRNGSLTVRLWGNDEGASPITTPFTEAAKQWAGWGTALKPAVEEWWLFRKPVEGTIAANVLAHGVGGLNIDTCRIPANDGVPLFGNVRREAVSSYADGLGCDGRTGEVSTAGRWPANLIHDGSDEVVGLFPSTGDSGSAARFFYCAKASKADRDEGCEGMPELLSRRYGEQGQDLTPQQTPRTAVAQRNHHPTVKPTTLMRYLCRLITPPGGIVLDPFMGSGSTGKAAIMEGFQFIGIEQDPEYFSIAKRRIQHAMATVQPSLDLPQPRQAHG